MNKSYLILEILIIFYILGFHFTNNKLIFAYEHCRHGARVPLTEMRFQKPSNNGV